MPNVKLPWRSGRMSHSDVGPTRSSCQLNGLTAHVAALICLFSKSHDCGQVLAHRSTHPPWAGSDSGREGRFTGTIWQRWSEGLRSLVVIHASRFRDCVCTERNCIGDGRKKKGDPNGQERPCGGKFIRRRRCWNRGPGRSRSAAKPSRQHLMVEYSLVTCHSSLVTALRSSLATTRWCCWCSQPAPGSAHLGRAQLQLRFQMQETSRAR